MIQGGQNETECRDLAQTLIDGVISHVEQCSEMLAELDNGSGCSKEGREDLETAKRTEASSDWPDGADAKAAEEKTAVEEETAPKAEEANAENRSTTIANAENRSTTSPSQGMRTSGDKMTKALVQGTTTACHGYRKPIAYALCRCTYALVS